MVDAGPSGHSCPKVGILLHYALWVHGGRVNRKQQLLLESGKRGAALEYSMAEEQKAGMTKRTALLLEIGSSNFPPSLLSFIFPSFLPSHPF